jgi:serine/threonine-protein kinase
VTDFLEGLRSALAPSLNIERELVGGGMSRVFVATDPSLERAVVVKVLPPERAAVLSAERFRREILIAARLQHPNIVPVLATGVANGLLWYSMPFVAGRSLRDRISEGGALSTGDAIPILRDVARALAFAHRQGVVHRDVKPDNVLLAEDGAATVTDFGIARALDTARTSDDASSSLTQAGNSLGTPHYMAPEQIAGDSLIDGRADIYAFGIMAYEMLTGRRPFADRPASQVLVAQLTESPTPLRTVIPGVPQSLADLVQQCLEKDPSRRPQSADRIVAALDAATTTGSVPSVSLSRLRTRVAIAAALVTVAGLGLFAMTRARAPELNSSLLVISPFRIVDRERELDWLREGMLDLLSTKLTGEGGIKAVAPRAALSQFRRISGNAPSVDATVDYSIEDVQQVARALGAGRVLLGELLPDARGLALHASLVDAHTGEEIQRFDVRASRDSVIWLADALGAELLTYVSGRASRGSELLAGVSLDALRPYLEGNALLRNMRSQEAAQAFSRALDADSTFALAGLGAIMALSWHGGQEDKERAIRAAWNGRARLTQHDQLLLHALLGPNYPARPSTPDILRAREALLSAAPDSPEAWYLHADHLFHFGAILGVANPMQKAEEGFRRSLALDSLYLPGSEHLLEIATANDDTALMRTLFALRGDTTGSSFSRQMMDWQLAVLRNDQTALKRIEDSSASANPGWMWSIADRAVSFNMSLESPLRIARLSVNRPGTDEELRLRRRSAGRLALIEGNISEGLEHLRLSTNTRDPLLYAELVRYALLGDGDSVQRMRIGEEAAGALAQLELEPLTGNDSTIIARREATRALAIYRLMRGDTSRAARDLSRLREAYRHFTTVRTDGVPDAKVDAHIEAVEALFASYRDTASARIARERLHETLSNLDWSSVHAERTVAMSLIAARLFLNAGDSARALHNASRTRVRNGDLPHAYVATQRRLVRELQKSR